MASRRDKYSKKIEINKNDLDKINLNIIGIDAVAYSRKNIITRIKSCKNEGKLILGGDAYLIVGNEIIITGDSWYIQNECVNIKYIDYAIEKSLEYVKNYKSKKGIPMFSLVVQKF